jgi:Sec-independent protein translocase protein TatA
MEILGIGPLELFFIVLIALIVLGPREMIKAGRSIGKLLRSIVTSPNWRIFQQTSREIRTLPNRLMREAGLEDIQKDLPDPHKIQEEMGLEGLEDDINNFQHSISDWTTPPTPSVNIETPEIPVQSASASGESPPDNSNEEGNSN